MKTGFYLDQSERHLLERISSRINVELQHDFYTKKFPSKILNYISAAHYFYKPFVFLLALTGLRFSDMMQINLSESISKEIIILHQQKTKNLSCIPFKLFDAELRYYFSFLFPMKNYVSYSGLQHEFKRLNIQFFRNYKLPFNNKTHLFRHLIASYMSQLNMPKEVIQNFLGHKIEQTQAWYIHEYLSLTSSTN